MSKYRFTRKAVEDLNNIWKYSFETWSEEQADLYYHMLIASCEKLAENPEIGKNYDEIFTDLKGYLAGKHVIFYRSMEDNLIEITRILHGRMDLKNKLND